MSVEIDTKVVLAAAEKKWNTLPYTPDLVGESCIGVNPYYLIHIAQLVGYHPDVILAGFRVNDQKGRYIADFVLRLMSKKRIHIVDSNIFVLGFAFKENYSDLINNRVVDLVKGLKNHNAHIDIYDAQTDKDEVKEEFNLGLIVKPNKDQYYSIILVVAHNEFLVLGPDGIHTLGAKPHVLYDMKSVLSIDQVDARL